MHPIVSKFISTHLQSFDRQEYIDSILILYPLIIKPFADLILREQLTAISINYLTWEIHIWPSDTHPHNHQSWSYNFCSLLSIEDKELLLKSIDDDDKKDDVR